MKTTKTEIQFDTSIHTLKPGDLMIAKFRVTLTREQRDIVRKLFEDNIPEGVKVLVVDDWCEIFIVPKTND